jgi:hypothetical protein
LKEGKKFKKKLTKNNYELHKKCMGDNASVVDHFETTFVVCTQNSSAILIELQSYFSLVES